MEKLIRIIDSTALSPTDSMKYAKHRKNKNGFKMHSVIDEEYLVVDLKRKNGRSSDKKTLKWRKVYPYFCTRQINPIFTKTVACVYLPNVKKACT